MNTNIINGKIKIVLFSGGRGTSNIIKFLSQHDLYSLSVIVNGYDDGLSTGEIRKIYKGILGPSDFRKTIGTVAKYSKDYGSSLSNLLEYRISEDDKWFMSGIIRTNNLPQYLLEIIENLPYKISNFILENLTSGIYDILKRGVYPHDFALGNIIISSLFSKTNDFNDSIKEFQIGLGLPEIVFNISDGTDLKLIGVTDELQILNSEASIVSQSKKNVKRVFLVKNYLTELELSKLSIKNSKIMSYLESISIIPEINQKVPDLVAKSDIIIYGPGTPNSSLFPTYLTKGLGTLIAKNLNARKIWISNLVKDNDMADESVETLFRKMIYYFNLGESVQGEDIANVSIIQKLTQREDSLTTGKIFNVPNPIIQKWDESNGKLHSTEYLEGVINHFASSFLTESKGQYSNPTYKSLTILVPVFNERSFINKTLEQLTSLELLDSGVIFNILVVDSGSTDGTTEIVNRYVENYGVKHILLPENLGIGYAVSAGIKMINSDYTIMFPSDAEYGVDAIYNSIELLNKNTQDKIYFGSRNISGYSKNHKFLSKVYHKNIFLRTLSRVGGILVTLFISVRIGTWVTDPLTSVKAFDTSTLKKLNLESTNFSYHGEIIRKAHDHNVPIQEFSVNYSPRSYKNGKKIRIRDGFLILLAILGLST
jgi:2-phospho-L-lactate transferase/gluconeogenesis factor (CofD/UPF0052 family)